VTILNGQHRSRIFNFNQLSTQGFDGTRLIVEEPLTSFHAKMASSSKLWTMLRELHTTVNFACFPASIKQLGVGMNIPDLECLLRIPKKTTHFRLYIATTCRTKRDAESTEAITQVVDRLLKHTHINQLFLSVPLIAVSDVLRLLRMAIHLGMTNLCLVVSKSSRAWKHNF